MFNIFTLILISVVSITGTLLSEPGYEIVDLYTRSGQIVQYASSINQKGYVVGICYDRFVSVK